MCVFYAVNYDADKISWVGALQGVRELHTAWRMITPACDIELADWVKGVMPDMSCLSLSVSDATSFGTVTLAVCRRLVSV